MNKPTPSSLYLRTDGSLMLSRGEHAIEVRLNAQQLLQLAVDSMQVAVDLDRTMLPAAAAMLEGFTVPPRLMDAAVQALTVSTVTPEGSCLLN